jgi:hypothetical protein
VWIRDIFRTKQKNPRIDLSIGYDKCPLQRINNLGIMTFGEVAIGIN